MLYILILLIIIIIFIIYVFLIVLKKYNKLKSDIQSITKAIKRVRYGDINIRVNMLYNKELENASNRLIETIYDREMMIKEYQSTLSKKNISLEEIIKQEKQLRLFKEDFAATLTHDMKVPVIAELNSLEYLLEGRFGKLNDKQTEILKLMKSSNQELKDLIENMLETYRLEQTELQLNITPNDFNKFILSVIKEMEPIIQVSKHNILYYLEETDGIIFNFDEFQLRRVIKNLIQNSISYSPINTTIDIRTTVSIDKIKFTISNKGNNISKDDLKMIFKKYYTLHSKFRKAGTGLGLYLAQQITIAHGGNIDVDNSKNDKTSFILTLPIKN